MRTIKFNLAFIVAILLTPFAHSKSNLETTSSATEMSMTDYSVQSSKVNSSEKFGTSPNVQESKSSAPKKRWKDRKLIGKILIITGVVIITALAALTGGISVY